MHLEIILMDVRNNVVFTGVIKENMVWKLKFMEMKVSGVNECCLF